MSSCIYVLCIYVIIYSSIYRLVDCVIIISSSSSSSSSIIISSSSIIIIIIYRMQESKISCPGGRRLVD